MATNSSGHHSDLRSSAIQRYDLARRDLVQTLERKLHTDTRLATRDLDRIDRRRQIMDQTSHILVPLSRFVEREIERLEAQGSIEKSLLDAEDVLMAVLTRAQDEIPDDITMPGIYPWLRQISLEHIAAAVESESERAFLERSLDSTIRRAGPDWPDHVLLLREVLADRNAVLPEEVIEQRVIWRILEHALDYLPERWREVFLLRSVDGWDDDVIAKTEGIDVRDVEMINIASRAYLRECLRDCQYLQEP